MQGILQIYYVNNGHGRTSCSYEYKKKRVMDEKFHFLASIRYKHIIICGKRAETINSRRDNVGCRCEIGPLFDTNSHDVEPCKEYKELIDVFLSIVLRKGMKIPFYFFYPF